MVTVIVVERVLVTVSFCGPDATITATTMPNPSASPEVMIRPIVVARPGGAPGEFSTPLRVPAGEGRCARRWANGVKRVAAADSRFQMTAEETPCAHPYAVHEAAEKAEPGPSVYATSDLAVA